MLLLIQIDNRVGKMLDTAVMSDLCQLFLMTSCNRIGNMFGLALLEGEDQRSKGENYQVASKKQIA